MPSMALGDTFLTNTPLATSPIKLVANQRPTLDQLVKLQPTPHRRTLSPGTTSSDKWRLVARSLTAGQLRHSAHGWRLYWTDSNSRWHLTHDVPTTTDVTPLLEVIDDPGRPPFLG